jgi:hypothetical protein
MLPAIGDITGTQIRDTSQLITMIALQVNDTCAKEDHHDLQNKKTILKKKQNI